MNATGALRVKAQRGDAQRHGKHATMNCTWVDRRAVLMRAGALALAGMGAPFIRTTRARALPTFDASVAFGPTHVQALAEQLAAQPFAKPSVKLPQSFQQLSYDQFRDIRFRTDQAIWRGEKLDFELQLLPMGWLFDTPVEIWLVDNGDAHRLMADSTLFSLGPLVGDVGSAAPYGFSGFRVHGPINRPDYLDEYIVFQGASYFRAVGRGQTYGLSARGLAIDTARPGGEEFPIFRAFWIEKPKPNARSITVHALLDSASTTGAYRFEIEPGEATTIDVEATLYPRRALTHLGLGPLTSMYLTGPGHHRIGDDFRPAVHDSDGLAIYNGNGECLWRQLTNPRTLQASAFMDRAPKGFGLCQRSRSFHDFEDLEARYERRPTVWIEPKGSWDAGYVELIEIPDERRDPRQHRRLLEAGNGSRARPALHVRLSHVLERPNPCRLEWRTHCLHPRRPGPQGWLGAVRRRLRWRGRRRQDAASRRHRQCQSRHRRERHRASQPRDRRRACELRARPGGNRSFRAAFGVAGW